MRAMPRKPAKTRWHCVRHDLQRRVPRPRAGIQAWEPDCTCCDDGALDDCEIARDRQGLARHTRALAPLAALVTRFQPGRAACARNFTTETCEPLRLRIGTDKSDAVAWRSWCSGTRKSAVRRDKDQRKVQGSDQGCPDRTRRRRSD